MRAKIGFYREGHWDTFAVETTDSTVAIAGPDGLQVSDEWITALPTAKGPDRPFTITENPQQWLLTMARAKYSTFGVRIEDAAL